jgi:hypothetical protein
MLAGPGWRRHSRGTSGSRAPRSGSSSGGEAKHDDDKDGDGAKRRLGEIEEAATADEDPEKLQGLFEKYRAEYLSDREKQDHESSKKARTDERRPPCDDQRRPLDEPDDHGNAKKARVDDEQPRQLVLQEFLQDPGTPPCTRR